MRGAAKDVRIAQLEGRVAALEKLVAELLEKLGRNSRNSHLPPSSDPPGSHAGKGEKSGRKPGGQPGHGGVTRKLVPVEDHPSKMFPASIPAPGAPSRLAANAYPRSKRSSIRQ